jgi:hypothetical protein
MSVRLWFRGFSFYLKTVKFCSDSVCRHLRYDSELDSTIVLSTGTGRTHQIRLVYTTWPSDSQ